MPWGFCASEWCKPLLVCQSGGGGDDSWAFARGTAAALLDHLANGASAGLVWEGYDSQYTDFNATTGGNNPLHWSYWGLFAVDDVNAATKTYTPRKGFYTLAQIASAGRRNNPARCVIPESLPMNRFEWAINAADSGPP